MGPVMNLVLAWLVMAVVLYQGAQLPAFDRRPGRHRLGDRQLGRRRRPACRPAIASSPSTGSRSSTWEEFSIAVMPKANRAVTLDIVRDGQPIAARRSRRARSASSRWATSASCRSCTREILDDQRRRAGGAGRPASARRRSWRPTASSNVSRERVIELIKAHEGQPLHARRPARRPDGTDHRDAAQGRRHRCASARRSRRSQMRSVKPGPLEALKLSAKQNWEWTRLIVQTLGGPVHARDVGQAADGPGGDRQLSGEAAQQGWIAAVQPDGDDQPEPRTAEPDADPGARRRPHLHPRASKGSPAATSA